MFLWSWFKKEEHRFLRDSVKIKRKKKLVLHQKLIIKIINKKIKTTHLLTPQKFLIYFNMRKLFFLLFSSILSFSACQAVLVTKPSFFLGLQEKPGFHEGENNFYLQNLPYRYKNHRFFLANFVMDGDMYNYFRSFSEPDAKSFIDRFLKGIIALSFIDIAWKPVCYEMKLLFAQEAQKSLPHPDFARLLEEYINNNWADFKAIFTCTINNPYSNWPNDLPYNEKWVELREAGGTLQIPFLYGLLPGTFPTEDKEGWRIGDAVRMTVNHLQTKPMLKYFYDELQGLDWQKRIFYEVKGPAVKVHITGDLRVIYHLATLLAALQTKFRFTDDEIRSIQIAPEDYMMAVRDQPGSSFRFDFLNPSDHHEVYKTKTVRFYNK